MNDAALPDISVIITAYNRKEFLLNAIKSAVNQTINKNNYEIIVIKNFRDDIIDNYILKNNIKGLISNEKSLGGKLAEALNIAKGDIISFLEDDDLFTNNKLEVVYNKFKNNDNLAYYHNGNIKINEQYQKVDIEYRNNIGFNMSSISVRKSILNLDNIKKTPVAQDTFMYMSALESGKGIIAGKEKLTSYMLHNSDSHTNTTDINEYIRHRTSNPEKGIKAFIIAKNMFSSKKVNNYIKQRIADTEIGNYIFGDNKKPENAFNVLKKSDIPFSSRFKIFCAYILARTNHNLRDRIRDLLARRYVNNNKKL